MIGAIRRRIMNVGKPKEDEYISEGLVFHLDGADATTSTWVDKVGGVEFAMHNVTLDADGGVVFSGTGSYGNYPNNLNFPISTHTIEVVVKRASNDMACVFMINAADNVAFGFSSGINYIVTKSGNSNKRVAWEIIDNGLHVYSVKTNKAFSDGNTMAPRSPDTWYLRQGGTFVGSRSADNAAFKGSVYQIRIYNRQLSDKEILHNQAIDMAKYGIN
jgi:hypothetical protein